MRVIFAIALGLFAMSGCAGSNNNGGNGGGSGGSGGGSGGGASSGGCSLVVSGPFTATLTDCATIAAYLAADGGSTGYIVRAQGPATLSDGGTATASFEAEVTVGGMPVVATYSGASPGGANIGSSVGEGNATWSQGYDGIPSDTAGTFSFSITNVGTATSDSTGETLTGVHGDLDITLPVTAVSGTATVSGTF